MSDMRDRDIIDAELRLLAAVRWSMVKWARDEMRRHTQLTERLITLPAAEGAVAAVPYLCWGPPVKVDPLLVSGVWPGSRAIAWLRWTAVGVGVERPELSEDERPRRRRGSAVN